jgi:hypothetical protein
MDWQQPSTFDAKNAIVLLVQVRCKKPQIMLLLRVMCANLTLICGFALQLMGVGGKHAAILTSFLDLPEPHK